MTRKEMEQWLQKELIIVRKNIGQCRKEIEQSRIIISEYIASANEARLSQGDYAAYGKILDLYNTNLHLMKWQERYLLNFAKYLHIRIED